MNDQNRYEDVPQKENKFLKGLKNFGKYIKFVFVDFFNSFKYNNMKLAAILFAIPGILLGFFMFAHVPSIRKVTVSYDRKVPEKTALISYQLNTSTSLEGDYELTIDKYNGYEKIVMKLKSYDEMKNDEGFDQDKYPIDGYSDSKTKQLPQPVITNFEDKSAASDETSNSYSLSIDGLSDNQSDVMSYAVFVFESVKIGETEEVDPLDPDKTITKSIYSDYFISSIYRTVDPSNTALNNFSTLNKDTSYKIAVKAIAYDNSEYYSSKISELFDISEIVTKSGSNISVTDYDETNTRYIRYEGTYTVTSVNGAAPNEEMSKFELIVSPNGYIVYKLNDSESRATIQDGGGSNSLQSVAIEKVRILPFDFSGLSIFLLTLLGFLNVFLSLELSKKKNLGTVIKCTLTTVGILGLGALYIYCLVATNNHLGEGKLSLLDDSNKVITTIFDNNTIISIVAVCGAALFSVAGLILAFINYDRTYEKADR